MVCMQIADESNGISTVVIGYSEDLYSNRLCYNVIGSIMSARSIHKKMKTRLWYTQRHREYATQWFHNYEHNGELFTPIYVSKMATSPWRDGRFETFVLVIGFVLFLLTYNRGVNFLSFAICSKRWLLVKEIWECFWQYYSY